MIKAASRAKTPPSPYLSPFDFDPQTLNETVMRDHLSLLYFL
jgi:hypothetical protein